MDGDDPNLDSLDDNLRDKLVAVGKAAGFIPFVGGPLAEIVGAVVPGQRADRIAAYFHQLADRFSTLEEQVAASIAASPPKVDLIEEGGFQAARALTEERIQHIAHAVAEGISQPEADVLQRKRLLNLLGELDDDEVALLHAHGQSYGGGGKLRLQYPPPIHLKSPRDDVDRDRLFHAGRDHLVRLGLLRKRFASMKKGELPEFDPSIGDFKHTVEISYLGRMYARYRIASAVRQPNRVSSADLPAERICARKLHPELGLIRLGRSSAVDMLAPLQGDAAWPTAAKTIASSC